MTAEELEAYLHEKIPLSATMRTRVKEANPDRVCLEAPLDVNINHAGTAFGGSIATLATLAGWSVMRLLTEHVTPSPRLVIRRSEVDYSAPITSDFEAHAITPSEETRERFLKQLALRGKAHLTLEVNIICGTVRAAVLKGDFVALTL